MAHGPNIMVSQDKLARLSFRRDLCNYVYYSETNGKSHGYLYETDEATYDKIMDILNGTETAQVNKKDRIFVLPGNTLPLKRIKAYAKSIGAYVTNEIEKATILAGNIDLEANAYHQAKFSHVMFQTKNYRHVVDNTAEYENADLEDTFDDILGNSISQKVHKDFLHGIPCIVSDYAATVVGYDNNLDAMNEVRYFLYPVALDALYYALAKKLPVVTQEYLTDNAHSDLNLSDPEVYKSLDDMFQSADKSNKMLAVQVISHAMFDNDNALCTYHLWKLRNEHGQAVNSKDRDKSVKHFVESSRWNELCLDTADYILYAEAENQLIKEVFLKLLPTIREQEGNDHDRSEFYECTHESNTGYVYRLRPKWLAILEPTKIIEHEHIEQI